MSVPQHIQGNFGRHARHYDAYCAVQNEVAGLLLHGYAEASTPGTILELGCGTGNLTRLLNRRFPEARILALDPCDAMIEQAQGKQWPPSVQFEVGGVDHLASTRAYDLVAANAALHWQDPPSAAMSRLAGVLRPEGVLLTSWFGPRTFEELGAVLEQWLQRPVQLAAHSFPDAEQIRAEVAARFRDVTLQEQRFRTTYDSLWQLLKTIKYTGTRGQGVPGLQLTRKDIRELDIYYRHEMNDISVTYQIYYVQARGNEWQGSL